MPRRGERKYTTMMLYPAMNTLTKNVPNRYLLVNVVARRARQIAEDAELEGIHLTEKPEPTSTVTGTSRPYFCCSSISSS